MVRDFLGECIGDAGWVLLLSEVVPVVKLLLGCHDGVQLTTVLGLLSAFWAIAGRCGGFWQRHPLQRFSRAACVPWGLQLLSGDLRSGHCHLYDRRHRNVLLCS